jgi:hypothetical protein
MEENSRRVRGRKQMRARDRCWAGEVSAIENLALLITVRKFARDYSRLWRSAGLEISNAYEARNDQPNGTLSSLPGRRIRRSYCAILYFTCAVRALASNRARARSCWPGQASPELYSSFTQTHNQPPSGDLIPTPVHFLDGVCTQGVESFKAPKLQSFKHMHSSPAAISF